MYPTYLEFFRREKQLVWTWPGLGVRVYLFEYSNSQLGQRQSCRGVRGVSRPPDGQQGGRQAGGIEEERGGWVEDNRKSRVTVIGQIDRHV